MTLKRRELLAGTAAAGVLLGSPTVLRAQNAPIRIGEINSYSTQAAFLGPYRNGWNLALEEANAAGGIDSRRLETLFRDDAGKPEDAVRHAGELVAAEKVDLLAGGFLSNIGLAVAGYAKQNKKLYVASEPLTDAIVWSQGNRYTFRLRPSTYMQAAMLVEEAAKLPITRWATISPNYEYGQSAVKWFKELLVKKKPGVQFVAEQFPALGRIDAGATAQAIAAANPEGIFNVTFAADLANLVRQGNTRGLFERRAVVSMLTGEPEYLDPLADEAPEGWIVTGYPWDQVNTPNHVKFREAYRRRFNDYPRLGSVVGYDTVNAIVTMLRQSRTTDTEKMVDAMEGLKFQSAFGDVEFRKIDHQATLGAFVGKTKLVNGKGTMVDWRYADGKDYLPSDAEVAAMRPKDA
ncbi:MAG: ABC transporter substrate-binding protein [Tagaea sp. CACIAM 22H2]|nr:ABC transporter substrate-binding protein [Tagaea sp. CACIAM 22H2]